jgi:hypothetical protein
MKYMLLVCWDAERMNAQQEPEPGAAQENEGFPWLDELQARGQWVIGDQLAPPRRAKSVRVRDGKRLVTDGPFAETREQLGGYFLVDAPNLDEALAIAERIPMARLGTVEVRPVVEIPGLPEASR